MKERFPSLRIARRFSAEVRPHRTQLIGVAFLSVLGAILGILRPWPIKWILDGALVSTGETGFDKSTIIWGSVAAAIVILIGQGLAQYLRDMRVAGISHQVTRGIRYRIFAHLSQLSPSFFSRHKSGDLLMRLMGDAPVVSTMLVDSSVEVAARLLLIVGTIVMMFTIDFWLTAGLLFALPVVFLVIRWISGRITIAVRKQRRKEGALANFLHEAISAAPVIQSLGGADHVVRRFARDNRKSARAGLKAKRLAARMSLAVESMLGIAFACALAVGSFRVVESYGDPDGFTPGLLIAYLSYVRSLIKPIRAASKHADRFAKGTACGERVLSVLDADERVRSNPGAPPAPAAPAELLFEGVTYFYEGKAAALQDVTIAFRKGELTLLAGRNGAGKSTLASLALRLLDPDEGVVRLDGQDLRDLDLASVRERVGLCMQHAVLFGDTLRENLLVARPEATEAELLAACQAADVTDILADLPDGLETALGANGVGLSGGQRQRLSLARTLLRGTSVLVVDEPFAGLDRGAANGVARTLQRLARDRIVVVISHDLEELSVYDRVILLDGGRVIANGSSDEVSPDRITESLASVEGHR